MPKPQIQPQPKQASRRVTLLDVARHAQVSRTTVSDVLNRGDAAGLYADATRQKVMEAVAALGYTPHAGAQQLARGRSNLIGLILLRDFANPYFARLADAVDQEVRARGMRLQLAVRSSQEHEALDNHAAEAQLISQMQTDAVEGVIIGPVYEDTDLKLHPALMSGRLPTILFGGETDAALDSVGEDSDTAWQLAINHLADLGHRRIGFLCAPPSRTDPTQTDHYHALRHLTNRGVFAGPQWVAWHPDDGNLDGYAEAADAFAEQWRAADSADRPTAVACLNDAVALVALGTFAERGIRVPHDLSVVGYDNLPESRHLVPRLTTVDNDVPGQIRVAVKRLLTRIKQPRLDPERVTVGPRLIERRSTLRPT
jgi:LacI family transcriptional regulator